MDGLSAAASVIAVIQIAQSIGGFLKDMYRDIREARTEIERLYDSVISLEIIAKGLEDLLKRRGIEMMNASLLEDPQGPLKQALSELKIVKEILDVEVVDGSRFEKLKLSSHNRLEIQKSSLLLDVDVNTLSLQLEHSDILQDVRKDIAAAQNDSDRQRLINWLSRSVPDPSLEHNKALKLHEATTGSWLVDGDDLLQWAMTPNSYIWLNGSAGAGKSILCSTAIAHIQSFCKNEPNTAVVYWYFTFRDSASQNVDQCLRSLITNLCSKRADTPKALQEAYEQSNNGQLSPSTRSLMKILDAAIEGFENVYILFDALDECPKSGKQQEHERDDLMDHIHEICRWNKECLHMLTTSRREIDIEQSLASLSKELENFHEISVHGTLVEEDIRKYIRQSVKTRQFSNWKQDLKEEVETKLATQANGMFRLVALQLEVLLRSKSVAAIRKALNTLPVTLDEFYDYTLKNIDEQYQQQESTALQWLAYSARPLSLSELAETIIIHPREEACVDPDERLMDENQILEFLPAGLVRTVNREHPDSDGRWLPIGTEAPFVEFAHFSAVEYLKSARIHPTLRETYQVIETKAHRMMAQSCLKYMLYVGEKEQTLAAEISNLLQRAEERSSESEINDEDSQVEGRRLSVETSKTSLPTSYASSESGSSLEGGYGSDDSNLTPSYWERWRGLCQSIDSRYPLAAYTNRAWHYHIYCIEQVHDHYLEKLALEFWDDAGSAWNIWCCFSFEEDNFFDLGLEGLMPYAVREDNVSPRYWMTRRPSGPWLEKIHPVTWLSFLGFHNLLPLLLNRYPDQTEIERTGNFGSPLHAAASKGNLQVVQLLLTAHADVNERSGFWDLPLYAAVKSGSLEVAEYLVRFGADVNPSLAGRIKKSILVLACENNSPDIVRMLLGAGANINTVLKGYRYIYGTALIAACSEGYLEIAKLLLVSGAEVNLAAEGSSGKLPLRAACRYGHLDIAKLLLESGADVNAVVKGNTYETPLVAACHSQSLENVKLLLKCGANINATVGDNNDTALEIASGYGSLEILELLLEWGANVNGSDDLPSSALCNALHRGSVDAVSLLLNAGANIGPKGASRGLYQTALELYEKACDYNYDVMPNFKKILCLFDTQLEEQQDEGESAPH